MIYIGSPAYRFSHGPTIELKPCANPTIAMNNVRLFPSLKALFCVLEEPSCIKDLHLVGSWERTFILNLIVVSDALKSG